MPDSPIDWIPSSGVWIVKNTSNSRSATRVCSKVSDLPEQVYDFGSIMMMQDDLASFICQHRADYAKEHNMWPSASETALAILKFLGEQVGIKPVQKKKPINKLRKINLTLE